LKRTLQTTEAMGTNRAPNASPTPGEILTVQEVAEHLRVEVSTIYEYTRFRQSAGTPRIPCRKVGRELRFLVTEVDAWFASLPKHKHLQQRQYVKSAAA
jgi:excisionase family DNA binding protein